MALPISYNVRNIIVRWKVTLLALAGISLVVGVLIALTAMANGFSKALAATGSADNAIVTQRGSASSAATTRARSVWTHA
jgi:putative ABC transport system permease protein